jgi:hypothetical protein
MVFDGHLQSAMVGCCLIGTPNGGQDAADLVPAKVPWTMIPDARLRQSEDFSRAGTPV